MVEASVVCIECTIPRAVVYCNYGGCITSVCAPGSFFSVASEKKITVINTGLITLPDKMSSGL